MLIIPVKNDRCIPAIIGVSMGLLDVYDYSVRLAYKHVYFANIKGSEDGRKFENPKP
jgi:hypothetical protein